MPVMIFNCDVWLPLQVRTERGVLPEDHPERVATRLGQAISAVEREDSSAATSILEAYMDDEEDRVAKVRTVRPAMQRAVHCLQLSGST